MGKTLAGGVFIVTASKEGQIEEWIAATSPKEAVVAVQLQAGPEWRVELTNRRLTPTEIASLNLRAGDVVRLIDRVR
jgi:hypothetical protein